MLKMPRLEELEIPPNEAKSDLPEFRLEYVTLALSILLLILMTVSLIRTELALGATQSAVAKLGKRFPALDLAESLSALELEKKQLTAELIEQQAEAVTLRQQIEELDSRLKALTLAAEAPTPSVSAAPERKITAVYPLGRPMDRLVGAIKNAVPYE